MNVGTDRVKSKGIIQPKRFQVGPHSGLYRADVRSRGGVSDHQYRFADSGDG
ncbi:hypothetical protein D3C73_1668870 [compost metagenome]